MLHSIVNSSMRHSALKDVSPDGLKGYLVPQMSIRNTHRPIPVTLYADAAVLRIGVIQIDIEPLMTGAIMHDLTMCGITATAWEDGTVGVSMRMIGNNCSAVVYFEYDYDDLRQKPLYLVRGRGHAPIQLKPFSQLTWTQKLAKVWPLAYPCVTM